MARFDVHVRNDDGSLVLDCQADTLRHLNSRFVAPLQLPAVAPVEGRRLNPRFEIDGVDYVMVTQFAAAIPRRSLGRIVVSLQAQDYRITNAIDMLLSGV